MVVNGFLYSLLYIFDFYIIIIFYNSSYIDTLNEKIKQLHFSDKFKDILNAVFVIDFDKDNVEKCPLLKQAPSSSASGYIINDILNSNEEKNTKNLKINYDSLKKTVKTVQLK